MGFFRGPRIVRDGLVMQLDAANIKSFRGEPTVNLFIHPLTDNFPIHGNTGFVREDDGNDVIWKYIFDGQTWEYHGYTYTVENDYYTLSFDVYISQDFPKIGSYFVFDMEGSLSYQAYYNCNNNGTWQHFETTLLANSGKANVLMYPTTDLGYNSGYILYRNVQFEKKDHATPFVNGTRGTTVATGGGLIDLSGYDNHGELVNGVLYDSNNCGSLVFDGIDDVIYVKDSPSVSFSGDSTYTLSAWVKPIIGGTTWYGVFSKGNDNSYAMNINSSQWYLQFEVYGSTVVDRSFNTNINVVTPNVYNHIVMVFDGNSQRIYVNNILINSRTTTLGTYPNTSDLRIGLGNDGEYFKGYMSNLHIYNRALSQSEIQQNYNATRGRFI